MPSFDAGGSPTSKRGAERCPYRRLGRRRSSATVARSPGCFPTRSYIGSTGRSRSKAVADDHPASQFDARKLVAGYQLVGGSRHAEEVGSLFHGHGQLLTILGSSL